MNRRKFLTASAIAFPLLFFPRFSQAQEQNLEHIIHRDYSYDKSSVAKANNQYLIDNLSEHLKEKLLNQYNTKIDISYDLEKLRHETYFFEHKFNEIDAKITYGKSKNKRNRHNDIFWMNPRQVSRIYLLLYALKNNPRFRVQIAECLINDYFDSQQFNDYYPRERGGLITFPKGIVTLDDIPDEDSNFKVSETSHGVKDIAPIFKETNSTYRIPHGTISNVRHLFAFHNHAIAENSILSVGPSTVILENGKKRGDLANIRERIILYGESHSIVITKLSGRNFNIFYYGGEKDQNGYPNINVLSLGNWKG
jgi:hypothetical protein